MAKKKTELKPRCFGTYNMILPLCKKCRVKGSCRENGIQDYMNRRAK
jgi:hypothetical protein